MLKFSNGQMSAASSLQSRSFAAIEARAAFSVQKSLDSRGRKDSLAPTSAGRRGAPLHLAIGKINSEPRFGSARLSSCEFVVR